MWDFWVICAYIYNCILIIFIAVHLLVGAIICFGAGLYSGIYLCQNYTVPKIDEPHKLWDNFVIFIEQYRIGSRTDADPTELTGEDQQNLKDEALLMQPTGAIQSS